MLPHLYFFKPKEFRAFADHMDPRLAVLLDAFRFEWDAPVWVSPVAGAIGRFKGPDDDSQHNLDRWPEVRAIDILPERLTTRGDAWRAIRAATRLGFTGIGIYPDWNPSPGLHLDVRRDREPGDPALWAMVRAARNKPQRMVPLTDAIAKMPDGDGTEIDDETHYSLEK